MLLFILIIFFHNWRYIQNLICFIDKNILFITYQIFSNIFLNNEIFIKNGIRAVIKVYQNEDQLYIFFILCSDIYYNLIYTFIIFKFLIISIIQLNFACTLLF